MSCCVFRRLLHAPASYGRITLNSLLTGSTALCHGSGPATVTTWRCKRYSSHLFTRAFRRLLCLLVFVLRIASSITVALDKDETGCTSRTSMISTTLYSSNYLSALSRHGKKQTRKIVGTDASAGMCFPAILSPRRRIPAA